MRRLPPLAGSLLALLAACDARPPASPVDLELVPRKPPAPPPAPSAEIACQRGVVHLLGTLREPMEVTAWVTTGAPKLDAFSRTLGDVLASYERLAPGKFHHRVVEATTDEQRAEAKNAGLQETLFGDDAGASGARIFKGFLGVDFRYRDERDAIPMMSPDQVRGLEFWLANKIREIKDRADGTAIRVGVITGKDEIKLSDANLIGSADGRAPNLKGIMEQALPFYKFVDVDLRGGDAEIDRGLIGLIVTQPGTAFTEKELRRIDQFAMLGDKAVTVIASAVNLKAGDAGMQAELDTRGLDGLLAGYGVEMRRDAVFDWSHPVLVRVMTQGSVVNLAHPGMTLAQFDARADSASQTLDQTFPGFFRMEELVLPFPSTLVPHPSVQARIGMHVVARTTPRATAATTATVDMKPGRGWKPTGNYAQRALAIALEPGCCDGGAACADSDPCEAGILRSAFAGKPDATIKAAPESAGKSRILVISSSQFLANPYARSGNAPRMPPQMAKMAPVGGDEELLLISQPYAQQYLTETILAFKDTLDWMANDEDSDRLLGAAGRRPEEVAGISGGPSGRGSTRGGRSG